MREGFLCTTSQNLVREKYPFTGHFGNTHAVPPIPVGGGGGACVNQDSKRLWQNLKSLGLKNKKRKEQEFVITIDGELCHDKMAIADEFNSHFTNVAVKLENKLPPSKDFSSADNDGIREFYERKGVRENSFELLPISEQFVLKELRKLNISKSTGLDMIPAKFLKDGAKVLFKPLSYLMNLSILTSTFPEDMKIAKMTPLHKKKDKTDVSNYRHNY